MGLIAGYKTYAVAACFGIVAVLRYLQALTPEQASAIEAFLIGGGFFALRQGVRSDTAAAAGIKPETVDARRTKSAG
jgi:hypothetical protein